MSSAASPQDRDTGSALPRQWFDGVRRLVSGMRPQRRSLLRFADLAVCDFTQQHPEGVTAVPIAQIQGSLSRTQDFDAEFRLLSDHSRKRLQGIRERMRNGGSLPPVELVQIDDIYYVRDGHHRIAAARSLGQDFIDAVILIHKVEHPEDQPST